MRHEATKAPGPSEDRSEAEFVRDPEGVPSWRDPTNYAEPAMPARLPSLNHLPADVRAREAWRWEFLRRHPAYRAAYRACGGVYQTEIGEQFGLLGLFPNPLERTPERIIFDTVAGIVSTASPRLRASFDLHRSRKDLVADFSHFIAAAKGKAGIAESRSRPERWPLQLRALDAWAQGATWGAIGKDICKVQGYDSAATAGWRLFRSALKTMAEVTRVPVESPPRRKKRPGK